MCKLDFKANFASIVRFMEIFSNKKIFKKKVLAKL